MEQESEMSVRNHSVQYIGSYMLILTEAERDVSKIIWVDKTFVREETCTIEHVDEECHLSCGHSFASDLIPCYCQFCGAKVIE